MSNKLPPRKGPLNAAVLLCLFITSGANVSAQDASLNDNQAQNVDEYVSLLRQDVQTQKVAITSQLMQLSPEQAAVFWPIYSNYAKELAALGDLRLRAVKGYVAAYSSLSDQKATELANMRLGYEEKLIALKKKYFQQMSKALSPKLAARFFQIENQLLDIVDLQIASSLPIVQ